MRPDADDAKMLSVGAILAGLEGEVNTPSRPTVATGAFRKCAKVTLLLAEAVREG